ncbi:MAG TPA: glycerol-3-phosphate 1-O-acyltransferase PlsY [Gemmatimonadaceae bacterium]|jgi:glycerol-3-phosphate acyltransferase PlsY|nr:glycerol-3-phosphate 1-O-acyltransferase PlsY [Gemmatimonadaceae bacterium]
MLFAVALVVAYLVGSIPTAYLVGRFKGIDVRKVGSGNMGATNVYRTLGAWPAAIVLAIDAAKGVAAALLPRWLGFTNADTWGLLLGVIAMLGHARPIFLGFRSGGKGVATAGGIFGALVPAACAVGVAAFLIVLVITRYVSLGSLVAAVTLAVAVAVTRGVQSAPFLAALAVATFVIWSHRSNIARLRRGEERRLGRPGAQGQSAPGPKGARP